MTIKIMIEDIETFLKNQHETLLADLAIHLMMDPDETRSMVEPLIKSGQVERSWQPRKTTGCKLCGCDNEEYLRWIGV